MSYRLNSRVYAQVSVPNAFPIFRSTCSQIEKLLFSNFSLNIIAAVCKGVRDCLDNLMINEYYLCTRILNFEFIATEPYKETAILPVFRYASTPRPIEGFT